MSCFWWNFHIIRSTKIATITTKNISNFIAISYRWEHIQANRLRYDNLHSVKLQLNPNQQLHPIVQTSTIYSQPLLYVIERKKMKYLDFKNKNYYSWAAILELSLENATNLSSHFEEKKIKFCFHMQFKDSLRLYTCMLLKTFNLFEYFVGATVLLNICKTWLCEMSVNLNFI